MPFKLIIHTENDAFQAGPDADQAERDAALRRGLAHCFRALAADMADDEGGAAGQALDTGSVRHVNGNRVGSWWIEEEG